MSINYIKHEQEFYGVCKLISGETIIGSMIATEEDNEPGVTLLYVSDPAVAQQHSVEKDGQMGMAVGFIKWMMWSSEDFYIIEEKDILTVAPMSINTLSP